MRSAWVGIVTLLVVLAGCGSDARSDRPSAERTSTGAATTGVEPIGPPPDVPWWSHGVLHEQGHTIRTPLSRIVTGGSTTLVGAGSAQGSTWRRVVGGRLVSFLSLRQMTVPRVSANGAYVAWVTSRDLRRYDLFTTRTAFTVRTYDVRRGRRVGTTTLVSRARCCDAGGVIQALGVDDDGAVVVHRMSGPSWMWWPGRDPVRIRLPLDQWVDAADQWPHGITFATHQDGGLPAAYARVDRRGRVHRVGTVPVASTGRWSPDGTAYAFSPVSKPGARRARVWVAGKVTGLDAPRSARVLMWESPTKVLLASVGDADIDPTRLFRCDVAGTCERAGRPLGSAVHLPETPLF